MYQCEIRAAIAGIIAWALLQASVGETKYPFNSVLLRSVRNAGRYVYELPAICHALQVAALGEAKFHHCALYQSVIRVYISPDPVCYYDLLVFSSSTRW